MPELLIYKNTNKPIVELWDYEGCGIVVEAPTGVFYTNQTGGNICNHPKAEGFFFPLNDRLSQSWGRLHDNLCGFSWNGEPVIGPLATSILEDEILPAFVKVDDSRLLEGEEAWVPVIFDDGRTGWFTYPNCD